MNLRQKPTGVWVVDYVDDTGARRRVSTGERDKAEARKRAKEIVLGVDVRPPPGTPKPTSTTASGTTMSQLWDRCVMTVWHPREVKSQATVSSNLKVLRAIDVERDGETRRFAELAVSEVSFAWLKALQAALLARGYAPGTVKRKMDMVGRSLTEAYETGVVAARPKMPGIKVDNFCDRVLSVEEEAAIFAAIDKRMAAEPQRPWQRFRALVRWLLDTGCRLGETLLADPKWIETIQGRAVVSIPGHATKTGKPRQVPLSAAVVAELPYLRMTAVPSDNGARLFPMSAATAWYMWQNVKADAQAEADLDLSDVKLHTLRHTCITRLIKAGLQLNRVSKWAGHADIKITMQRYAHLDTDDLFAGVDIINAGPPTPHLRAVSSA